MVLVQVGVSVAVGVRVGIETVYSKICIAPPSTGKEDVAEPIAKLRIRTSKKSRKRERCMASILNAGFAHKVGIDYLALWNKVQMRPAAQVLMADDAPIALG